MATRKTPEEKLLELEKKQEQIKAQKKAIQSKIGKAERAQRTRRLIENGALAEKYFNCRRPGWLGQKPTFYILYLYLWFICSPNANSRVYFFCVPAY